MSEPDQSRVLPITIRTATGKGRTPLSAFDAALLAAGVGNFNLVRLSSVIPQPSRISFDCGPLAGEHGDRLYAVWASACAELPGETVWAGVGWVRDESGRGLFVEHTAGSEETLLELIHLSLEDLDAHRGGGYGEISSVTVCAHHDDLPACALAIATFHVDGWELT